MAACIAWHFHEIDSVMQFRTDRFSTPMAPASEIIYDTLRELALVQPDSSATGGAFLNALAAEHEIFKIILTSRPQARIPTALWSSSYFVFIDYRCVNSAGARHAVPERLPKKTQCAFVTCAADFANLIAPESMRECPAAFRRPSSDAARSARLPPDMHRRSCGRRAQHFQPRAATRWFRTHRRELPWRASRDPYRVWVAEIMLQQTRIAAVIPYYDRFLARFPDVRALARAPQAEVLKFWSGLGYYSRARNLHSAAKEIVAKHDGEFPRELERRARPARHRPLHSRRGVKHRVR